MITIGNNKITLEHIKQVSDKTNKVSISDSVRKNIEACAAYVQNLSMGEKAVYSINTGFGSLKDVKISKNDLLTLQKNLIRSHAVGLGSYLSIENARAMMFLRAHTLAQGYSGIRLPTIELLVSMLNADIVPCIPELGSVGASGDLAPLSHLALALIGEGKVFYQSQICEAKDALTRAGLKPIELQVKEGLALINGTQMIGALGALACLSLEKLLEQSNMVGAMSLEALMGSSRAFDEDAMKVKGHEGQMTVASHLRSLLVPSEIADSHKDCNRVQDPYSFRCMPQVHGAMSDALKYVRKTVETEINGVTDNPILFHKRSTSISAGNFHGQYVAQAMDFACIAATPVMSMSERRQARLLNHFLTDLPAALINTSGLNSGMMMVQVSAAAMVSEAKSLSHPASVDSIPTWEDQEDHVSMGAFAARKAQQLTKLFSHVLACEAVIAAQALEFRRPLKSSTQVEKVFQCVRDYSARLDEDRVLSGELIQFSDFLMEGGLLKAVS